MDTVWPKVVKMNLEHCIRWGVSGLDRTGGRQVRFHHRGRPAGRRPQEQPAPDPAFVSAAGRTACRASCPIRVKIDQQRFPRVRIGAGQVGRGADDLERGKSAGRFPRLHGLHQPSSRGRGRGDRSWPAPCSPPSSSSRMYDLVAEERSMARRPVPVLRSARRHGRRGSRRRPAVPADHQPR